MSDTNKTGRVSGGDLVCIISLLIRISLGNAGRRPLPPFSPLLVIICTRGHRNPLGPNKLSRLSDALAPVLQVMPRPVRRPKKVQRRAEVLDARPDSVDSTTTPPRDPSPVLLDPHPSRSGSVAPQESSASPAAAAKDTKLSLSEDEFGFHELHDIHPVLKRPTLDKVARPLPSPLIFADPEDDGDLVEEEEEDELSIASSPAPVATKGRQEDVNSRVAALKTAELQNLLPRHRNSRLTKKRPTRGQENPDSESELSQEEDDDDHDAAPAARKKKSLPVMKRKKNAPVSKLRAGATQRPSRTQKIMYQESDAEGSEDDIVDVDPRKGISNEDRIKLSGIKAQFEELKEWHMEVEIVSSPFYSS